MDQCRPLGTFEKRLANAMCTIVAPCRLSMVKPLIVDHLQQAVEHVVRMTPNLRACIVPGVNDELLFEPVADVHDVFEVMPSSTDWHDVCLHFQKNPLRQDQSKFCLFKVFLIQESNTAACLITIYHHCIGDGTNGMSITNDVLTAYTKIADSIPLDGVPHVPPPTADSLKLQHLGDRYQLLREAWLQEEIANRRSFNCYMPVEFADPPANMALYFTSSCEEFNAFTEICKRSGITVGSALIASMFFGFASTMISVEGCNLDTLVTGCGVPANLRGRVDSHIPKNNVGLIISNMSITASVSRTTSFLKLAEDIHEKLRLKLNADHCHHCFDYYTEEDVAGDPVLEKRMRNNGMVFQNMCCSNMGRYPTSVSYGKVKIESLHCVGGVWGPRRADTMQLMVYSTDKFNLSLVHTVGESNIKRAKSVFKSVTYFAANMKRVSNEFTLEDYMHVVLM